jgi:hypothetical protein
MAVMPLKFWFVVLFVNLFIAMAITWILFARLSMARIERQMKQDNRLIGFEWDGIGSRIFLYAFAIVFSDARAKRIDRLINVSLVRSYSTHGDWLRGLFFLIASNVWAAVIFIGIIFDI